MSRMTISDAGLQMLKRFEGFRERGLALPDGQWLIGHGRLSMAPLSQSMTREQAHHDLLKDLKPYEEMIHARVRVPLTQTQFDALASFSFSIGLAAFERSDVLRRLNAGDVIAAAVAIDAWRKTRIGGQAVVLDALVRRRALERAMLLESEEDPVAPSVLVRPQIDHAAAILGAPVGLARMALLEETMLAAAVPEDQSTNPAPQDAVAQRIATILAQQPATAMALAAPAFGAAHDEPFDPEGPDDLPPPSLPSDKIVVSAAAPAAVAERGRAAPPPSRRSKTFHMAMDIIALIGLLIFGLALLALAALAFTHGDAGGGPLTAAILGAPGALAVAMAAFYLAKGQDDR
jgi:lysozyme